RRRACARASCRFRGRSRGCALALWRSRRHLARGGALCCIPADVSMARPTKTARDARRNAQLPRFISVYGVLLVSVASAIAVFYGLTWLLSPDWPAVRYVLAWDVGSLVYLGFALVAITRFDIRKARKRASDQDEGAILVLIFAVIAAAVSFAAIVELLGAIEDSDPQRGLYFTLAALTILISWILI